MIRLTDEEISQAKKGLTAVILAYPSVYLQDTAVAKAQLKKVVGELNHYYIGGVCIGGYLSRIKEWQALFEEMKDD